MPYLFKSFKKTSKKIKALHMKEALNRLCDIRIVSKVVASNAFVYSGLVRPSRFWSLADAPLWKSMDEMWCRTKSCGDIATNFVKSIIKCWTNWDLDGCALPLQTKAVLFYSFRRNAEITWGVQRFFRMQSSDFFLEAFLKLIKAYSKCLELLGNYLEK